MTSSLLENGFPALESQTSGDSICLIITIITIAEVYLVEVAELYGPPSAVPLTHISRIVRCVLATLKSALLLT